LAQSKICIKPISNTSDTFLGLVHSKAYF